MTSTTGTILRTDKRGRVRRTRAQKEAAIDEYERSGLSGPKFAALAGIPYQTFATWVQRRRREEGPVPAHKTPAPVRWLEAVVDKSLAPGAVLKLQLPGGGVIELSTEAQARLAAKLLQELAAC